MSSSKAIQPMSLTRATIFFGIPFLAFLAMQTWIVPALAGAGVSYVACFLIAAVPHVLFFIGALVGYRREGRSWSRSELAERFRFHRMTRRTWAWTIAAVVGDIGSYLLVFIAARPLLVWLRDLFPEPQALGEMFGDATTFLGHPLAGNAWLLGIFFVYYFFNVVGEELWWRGYIFPRQELIHGQRTWIVHGLLWTAFHLFTPYNAVMVLPGALWVSWIYQRQRNIWVFIIAHGTMNALAMIRLVNGIFG